MAQAILAQDMSGSSLCSFPAVLAMSPGLVVADAGVAVSSRFPPVLRRVAPLGPWLRSCVRRCGLSIALGLGKQIGELLVACVVLLDLHITPGRSAFCGHLLLGSGGVPAELVSRLWPRGQHGCQALRRRRPLLLLRVSPLRPWGAGCC